MTAILLFLLLPVGPRVESVDVIELNHVYSVTESRNDFGIIERRISYVASYYDFWERTSDGLHIRDWVGYKAQPITFSDGTATLTCNGERGSFLIRGKIFRETWTGHDAERTDQEAWPTSRRRRIEGLRK